MRLDCLAVSELSVLRRLGERMLSVVAKVDRSGYLEAAATLLRKLTSGLARVLYCSLGVFLVFSATEAPAKQFKIC